MKISNNVNIYPKLSFFANKTMKLLQGIYILHLGMWKTGYARKIS